MKKCSSMVSRDIRRTPRLIIREMADPPDRRLYVRWLKLSLNLRLSNDSFSNTIPKEVLGQYLKLRKIWLYRADGY